MTATPEEGKIGKSAVTVMLNLSIGNLSAIAGFQRLLRILPIISNAYENQS